MMDSKRLELTEEEQTAAGRAQLTAALEALGDFPRNIYQEDQDETARRVVCALVAAGTARNAEIKRLSEAKGGRVSVHTEAHEAVATAFWVWSEQINLDVTEVNASSVAGSRYLALAQGLAAARAMTEALDMLEDGSMFAFTSRGALHLASKC